MSIPSLARRFQSKPLLPTPNLVRVFPRELTMLMQSPFGAFQSEPSPRLLCPARRSLAVPNKAQYSRVAQSKVRRARVAPATVHSACGSRHISLPCGHRRDGTADHARRLADLYSTLTTLAGRGRISHRAQSASAMPRMPTPPQPCASSATREQRQG